MSGWDFSESTDAELATLKANITAKLNAILTGKKRKQVGAAAYDEFTPSELRDLQGAINAEIRQRDDNTGDLIDVEFEELEA